PSAIDAGTAAARFALLEPRGRELRVVSQLVPPPGENVFEGTGVEAYATDLDGDGRPEVVVRARYQPGGEVPTLLQNAEQALQCLWRATTAADERAGGTAAQPEVRRCTVGEDAGPTLVVRCEIERYAVGAARDSQPLSRARLVQRVRFNGGALQV